MGLEPVEGDCAFDRGDRRGLGLAVEGEISHLGRMD